ncbi:MAG: hypothetical protein ABIJ09_02760 [Pseudomonadota bacterium]
MANKMPLVTALVLVMGVTCSCFDPCDGAQAWQGDALIHSDEDVALLEGMLCVKGHLLIGNVSLDLNNGVVLDTVSSEPPSVSSLAALDKLQLVERYLVVQATGSLHDLKGLEHLTEVGREARFDPSTEAIFIRGALWLQENGSLETLAGLEALTHIGSSLHISDNPVLGNIDGLSALNQVGGDFRIRDNPQLPASAIQKLKQHVKVAGDVEMQ